MDGQAKAFSFYYEVITFLTFQSHKFNLFKQFSTRSTQGNLTWGSYKFSHYFHCDANKQTCYNLCSLTRMKVVTYEII
jgi:hypothetical protein